MMGAVPESHWLSTGGYGLGGERWKCVRLTLAEIR